MRDRLFARLIAIFYVIFMGVTFVTPSNANASAQEFPVHKERMQNLVSILSRGASKNATLTFVDLKGSKTVCAKGGLSIARCVASIILFDPNVFVSEEFFVKWSLQKQRAADIKVSPQGKGRGNWSTLICTMHLISEKVKGREFQLKDPGCTGTLRTVNGNRTSKSDVYQFWYVVAIRSICADSCTDKEVVAKVERKKRPAPTIRRSAQTQRSQVIRTSDSNSPRMLVQGRGDPTSVVKPRPKKKVACKQSGNSRHCITDERKGERETPWWWGE